MPPNRFESEVESFLEGSHGDRTHIKRADHHTVTPLCGTLLLLSSALLLYLVQCCTAGACWAPALEALARQAARKLVTDEELHPIGKIQPDQNGLNLP